MLKIGSTDVVLVLDRDVGLWDRPAGGGLKPPQGASVRSRGAERGEVLLCDWARRPQSL